MPRYFRVTILHLCLRLLILLYFFQSCENSFSLNRNGRTDSWLSGDPRLSGYPLLPLTKLVPFVSYPKYPFKTGEVEILFVKEIFVKEISFGMTKLSSFILFSQHWSLKGSAYTSPAVELYLR